MGRLDFVFLELSGAPLNEKLQRKNLSSTHTRRGIHRPYPTQLKQEHTSNKPGYKHHKDPREKIIYKIFKKKIEENLKKNLELEEVNRRRLKTEEILNSWKSKIDEKVEKTVEMSENDSVDEIHTEGMKQQEIASIDQLSDGKPFYFLANFWWPRLFLIVPDLRQDGLPFVRFGLRLIEGLFRLWIRFGDESEFIWVGLGQVWSGLFWSRTVFNSEFCSNMVSVDQPSEPHEPTPNRKRVGETAGISF